MKRGLQTSTNLPSPNPCWDACHMHRFIHPVTYLDGLLDSGLVCADFGLLKRRNTLTNPRYESELGSFAHLVSSLNTDVPIRALTVCSMKITTINNAVLPAHFATNILIYSQTLAKRVHAFTPGGRGTPYPFTPKTKPTDEVACVAGARRGKGRGERKRAEAGEEGKESARGPVPIVPRFCIFPLFSPFPRVLAVFPLKKPLRRRE